MDKIELNAAPRQVIGKQVKALPGEAGADESLWSLRETGLARLTPGRSTVCAHAGGRAALSLNVKGREPLQALAREIQREPITGACIT
jgi:hypothetical protein